MRTLWKICLLTLATACTGSGGGTDPKTLVIGIESEVKNLDLKTSMDANSGHVIGLYAQSLLRINEAMLPETDLALHYAVEDNGKRYVFTLPTDSKFHDGKPLLCEDVVASFKQAAGPGSRIQSSFTDVESFECTAPDQFVIKVKIPKASFLVADVSAVRIMPKAVAEATGEAPTIGTGPYKYMGRNDRDIIFERFEGFRRHANGKPQPKLFFDKVIVRQIQDPTTRWLSLSSGDVDVLVNALSPQKVLEAEKNEKLEVHRKPGTSFQYLGFNLRLPKFKDPRVRQALAMAINRDQIIEHKLMGLATKADSVLSPINFFHAKELTSRPYDPEGAKKLLKEAGAENLEIELKTSSDRDVASIVLVIKEMWERVGVKVTVRPYEFATFFADVQKGSFEVFSLRWTAVTEPDILFQIFNSKEVPPGRNRVYYSNAEVDRLTVAGAREFDQNKRREIYNRVQQIISEENPYVSLWYPDNVAVSTKRLKDYDLHSTGSWWTLLLARKE
jgi:peptide/nickel transport system substrate-binding protein